MAQRPAFPPRSKSSAQPPDINNLGDDYDHILDSEVGVEPIPYPTGGVDGSPPEYSHSATVNQSATYGNSAPLDIPEAGSHGYNSNYTDRRSPNWKDRARAAARNVLSGNPRSKDILIAVMGMTGSGKSTFISRITGASLKIGHSLQSCTQEIEIAQCTIEGHTVTFIDTPGFDDTDRSDTDVLQSIATWLQYSYNKDMRLTGLVYLHRILDTRVAGSAMKNLRMFRNLCGEENMKNVVLATSMWNRVSPEDGERREKELTSSGKFWAGMLTQGARVFRWDGTKESATDISRQLINLEPVVLLLQKELLEHTSLVETSAGKEVKDDIERRKKEREEDLKIFREQIEEAQRTQNLAMLEETRKLYDEQIAGLKKANEDLLRLSRNQAETMQKRIDELQDQLARKKCVIL